MVDVNSLDSVIPSDFPRAIVNGILGQLMSTQYAQSPIFAHFNDAWTAVVYRFCTCAEHDKAYQASIRRVGSHAPRLEQYFQERDLFGFFICGLTAIESFYYGCYSLAAMLDADNFSMDKPRSIVPDKVANKFLEHYSGEILTVSLDQLRKNKEYEKWSSVRNILAHRTIPARLNKVTIWPLISTVSREVSWIHDTIVLDTDTTASRRKWLATTITELMSAAENFVLSQFS